MQNSGSKVLMDKDECLPSSTERSICEICIGGEIVENVNLGGDYQEVRI